MKSSALPKQSEYYSRFRGRFYGVLKWQQLDELWKILKSQTGTRWYIYAIGDSPPEQPATPEQFNHFISEIDVLLRKEHDSDYCGIVYADDLANPSFIKIYDPHNLGVVCGFSDQPPLPGWTLSLIKPELLDNTTFVTRSRKRWWNRIFS